MLQFLQAEKAIRIRSLVKMGFYLSDIQHIFEADNDTKSAEVEEEVSILTDSIENFRFEEFGVDEDQAIIYAISG